MKLLLLLAAVLVSSADADWPTYGFTYDNARHTPLTQISARSVATLQRAWEYQSTAAGQNESSPIVVHGVMYVTTGERNSVVALDAQSGVKKWEYTPALSHYSFCCAKANRGVAVADGLVFLATLDGRLIALDERSGSERWEVQVGDPRDGFSETMAPLVWRDMVFIGSSGGDFGIRGSFSAYRAADGTLLWRWWSTNPGWEGPYVASVHGYSLHRDIARERADAPRFRDAWRHGGGAVWMTPALDVERDTIYLSTGNPAPNYNASTRPGDNLYTNSIVALDALTGKMRWWYQETPHDVWDYDAASPPFLFDALDRHGHRVAAVGEAGKTGWLYVLNRDTGAELRVSDNIVPQHDMYAARGDQIMEPGVQGGAIGPASFDPGSGLAFLVAIDRPDEHVPGPVTPRTPDTLWLAGHTRPVRHSVNDISAVDPSTGRVVWRRRLSGGPGERFNLGFISGSLSAGDIVFVPEPNGVFYALDARTGNLLWRTEIGLGDEPTVQNDLTFVERFRAFVRSIYVRIFNQPEGPPAHARLDGPPIRYVVNGREYIALCADVFTGGVERNVVIAFALPR
ncbi:MAG TPA: PQQ-binding-like beta-propeller repeat protein [Candidatus Eremiobacteraceae bacterium]|nr:PQQ-binding-like beta-propeller repeat protein [Candidatus Eremiobacteraceae bacterium]